MYIQLSLNSSCFFYGFQWFHVDGSAGALEQKTPDSWITATCQGGEHVG